MAIIKTEVEGIFRDTSTGALLNRDNGALNAYKKQKAKRLELEKKVDKLENDISDIKGMLLQLIEKDK